MSEKGHGPVNKTTCLQHVWRALLAQPTTDVHCESTLCRSVCTSRKKKATKKATSSESSVVLANVALCTCRCPDCINASSSPRSENCQGVTFHEGCHVPVRPPRKRLADLNAPMVVLQSVTFGSLVRLLLTGLKHENVPWVHC